MKKEPKKRLWDNYPLLINSKLVLSSGAYTRFDGGVDEIEQMHKIRLYSINILERMAKINALRLRIRK